MATIIVKATEKCNSNCYYCDVVYKKDTGKSMPLEILETLFIRINEFLKAEIGERVEILWHGGEPLLLGPQYYMSALKLQDKHCLDTKNRITHNIQTNLTCFNSEFMQPFKELGIHSIGTSYDPEPHMRGPGKRIDSDTYNRRFMQALELLDRNDIAWGLIYVVTKKSLAKPLDIFLFLSNLTMGKGFNMNPVLIYDDKRKNIAITPEEFVEFLGAIFPYWWKYRQRYPDVNPFKGLVENVINRDLSLSCGDSGACTYHHINVAPDGQTSQCGRSADWGLLQYGNIRDKSLGEILHDQQRDPLNERIEVLPKTECSDCRFWDICHGGCPLDAYSQHGSFMHKSEWCEAKRGFMERYFEPVTGVKFESRKQENCKK